MKKFLSYCLVALMLVACVSVAAGAVDFVAGKGYDLYSGASYGEAVNEGKAPVTMTINADGSASVEQAGYYKDPTGDENFGGIATANKVGLDGLVVEIAFDEVPAVTSTTDCWFGIHLMEKPYVFHTGKIAENRGYIPLIRFNRPNITFYEGVTGFSSTGQSEIDPNIFGFKAGDVIKMSVKYELGQFLISYEQNGTEVYEVPAEQTLKISDEVFVDGTAYVVVTGTCLGAESNFKYNVKVTEGVALTAEQIEGKAFEKSKKEAADTVEGAVEDVADYAADAVEVAAGSTAAEVTDALAVIDAANVAVVEARDALYAATEQAVVDEALQTAITAKNDAKAALEAIESYIENFGAEEAPVEKAPEETPAEDEAPVVDEAPEEEGGSNLGLIIAIIVIVVVVVVVVLVVLKKKKK